MTTAEFYKDLTDKDFFESLCLFSEVHQESLPFNERFEYLKKLIRYNNDKPIIYYNQHGKEKKNNRINHGN